jgi:hypothetical protein
MNTYRKGREGYTEAPRLPIQVQRRFNGGTTRKRPPSDSSPASIQRWCHHERAGLGARSCALLRRKSPSSAKRLPTGCAFCGKQSRAFAAQQSRERGICFSACFGRGREYPFGAPLSIRLESAIST